MTATCFEDCFSEKNLRDYFDEHLFYRNGGGRDKMSPIVFQRVYGPQFEVIARKCREGKYKFTFYNERLVLKGKNKSPRVLSIPAIRDRLVLGVLNQYLQSIFPECVSHDVPNHRIYELAQFIEQHRDFPIYFLKTDIKSFYDSISQKKLMNILGTKIIDDKVLSLIRAAIQNPTCSLSTSKQELQSKSCLNKQGVPQGLAISNILAAIYLNAFDAYFESSSDRMYVRYVDDILFLQLHAGMKSSRIKNYFTKNKLSLSLSKDKTATGKLGEKDFDFLGYSFTEKGISVCFKNVERQIRRMASLCTTFKKEFSNPKRIFFKGKDSEYITCFICEMNMLISGFKHDSHYYGWLPYFRSATDISLFYRLDYILKKQLMKDFPEQVNLSLIHSYVQSYYELKNVGGGRLILDLNKQDTVEKQTAFLRKMGRLQDDKDYSNEEIHAVFEKYIYRKKKQYEVNIGYH